MGIRLFGHWWRVCALEKVAAMFCSFLVTTEVRMGNGAMRRSRWRGWRGRLRPAMDESHDWMQHRRQELRWWLPALVLCEIRQEEGINLCARKREVEEYQNLAAGSPLIIGINETWRRQRRAPASSPGSLEAQFTVVRRGNGRGGRGLLIAGGMHWIWQGLMDNWREKILVSRAWSQARFSAGGQGW
jgi:hypothetical protein